MIKKVLFLTLILIYGCSSSVNEEKIRADIQKKKDAIISLETEIKKLEKTLIKNGLSDMESRTLVSVKKAVPEKFEHFYTVNGSVEAFRDAYISPEISGTIKKIYVEEGRRVRKNEILVELSSGVIESSIVEVRNSLRLAETIFKKRSGLWEKNIGSEVQYLEAKNLKESLEKKIGTLNEQLEMTRIRAPFDGIIDNIEKKQGELAVPGSPLMQLVDLSKVYVRADVSESYLSKVKVGDDVIVTFPSYPEMLRKARIIHVGAVINPQNRTFEIKFLLDNSGELLKPNIVAVIELRDYYKERAIIVPSIIVRSDDSGSYLYRINDSETGHFAEKVYVETGMANRDMIMIVSGLEFGDEVIMKGYNLVKNGSLIKISGVPEDAGKNE